MFESRISAGAAEKLPGWDKPRAKTSVHGRTCSKMRGAVLRIGKHKTTDKLYKVSHPFLDDHEIKKEELDKG